MCVCVLLARRTYIPTIFSGVIFFDTHTRTQTLARELEETIALFAATDDDENKPVKWANSHFPVLFKTLDRSFTRRRRAHK